MHGVDPHKDPNTDRRERAIGVVLLVLALVFAVGALMKIQRAHERLAEVAQADSSTPAQSAPDQARPTTPADQQTHPTGPVQPQVRPGDTTGSSPPAAQDRPPVTGKPLPPAPAEKIAPPIKEQK